MLLEIYREGWGKKPKTNQNQPNKQTENPTHQPKLGLFQGNTREIATLLTNSLQARVRDRIQFSRLNHKPVFSLISYSYAKLSRNFTAWLTMQPLFNSAPCAE